MTALASYAKQSHDDDLYTMAIQIKVRAIDRCGELLNEIEPAQGKRTDLQLRDGDGPKSRKDAAQQAGLSERQKKIALRVHNVPRDQFEALVESDEPPTVTECRKS